MTAGRPAGRTRLSPGRVVAIGSGIIEDRLGEVVRAGAASGLARVAVLASGEWRAAILPGPRPGG